MGRLHYATRRGLLSEIESAIEAGEPLNDLVGSGLTPLHIASQEGFTKIVRLLLDAGADPLVEHPNGRTALHFAAGGGHLNAVAALADHGVPVDIQTRGGTTPALEAAELNYREAVEFLLQRGADPNVGSKRGLGKTVSEWLAVGGVQGEFAHLSLPASERPDRWLEAIRNMMAERSSVEEYAAHHGRRTLLYSLDQDDLSDPEADRWAKRYGEIVRSPELLAECEDAFLQGEALAETRRRRELNTRAAIRRAARDEALERRRKELS